MTVTSPYASEVYLRTSLKESRGHFVQIFEFDSVIPILLLILPLFVINKQLMKKYKSIPHQFFQPYIQRKKQQKSDNESFLEQVRQLRQYCGPQNYEYSSIKAVDREYFPHFGGNCYDEQEDEELVLVPKRKLETLYEQIRVLKRAIKSQHKMFRGQISNLRRNADKVNKERRLLMRQTEYLKDMERCGSEGKFERYRMRRWGR